MVNIQEFVTYHYVHTGSDPPLEDESWDHELFRQYVESQHQDQKVERSVSDSEPTKQCTNPAPKRGFPYSIDRCSLACRTSNPKADHTLDLAWIRFKAPLPLHDLQESWRACALAFVSARMSILLISNHSPGHCIVIFPIGLLCLHALLLWELRGPRNRLNAIFSLLRPLDGSRTPSTIETANGRSYLALSRIHTQVGLLNRLALNHLGSSTARLWCYGV